MECKYVSHVTVIFLVIVSAVPIAFAERTIDFQKVVDIEKNSFERYLRDFASLEDVFPQNIKSIDSVKETESGNLFKLSLDMNGISLNPQIVYKESENKHLLKVIDGDLKGTIISITLQETWGFDGTPKQGTVVNVKTSLQVSGLLSLVNLLPDQSILYTLDYGLLNIVADANGKSISKDSKDVQSTSKKGHRTR